MDTARTSEKSTDLRRGRGAGGEAISGRVRVSIRGPNPTVGPPGHVFEGQSRRCFWWNNSSSPHARFRSISLALLAHAVRSFLLILR